MSLLQTALHSARLSFIGMTCIAWSAPWAYSLFCRGWRCSGLRFIRLRLWELFFGPIHSRSSMMSGWLIPFAHSRFSRFCSPFHVRLLLFWTVVASCLSLQPALWREWFSSFCCVFVSFDFPFMHIGSALIALGMTPLIVLWGEMYRYLNPKGEQLFVTLGAIVLSVMLYAVETNLPQPLPILVFAVMVGGSFFCLCKSETLLASSSSSWKVRKSTETRTSPALFLVCIFAFSIPYNYLRGSAGVDDVVSSPSAWSSVLALTVVIMLLVALAEVVAERHGALLVPSFVLLLLSAAMAVHLLGDGSPGFMSSSLLYSGYYLFLAMVYLALGPIVATAKTNANRLFSGAMMANVGGLLAGFVLGGLGAWLSEEAVTVVVMAVTYVIFLSGFIMLYNKSCSIFRVNSFDEEEYSFDILAPVLKTLGQDSGSVKDAEEPDAEMKRSQASFHDVLALQCSAVSEKFGLSVREKEVLFELVSGRTIASIAADLVLSENTIKAHTKSIYRKLDVHTREELLGFVQGV